MACGRRQIEVEESGREMMNLVDWVWRRYTEGRIVDEQTKGLKTLQKGRDEKTAAGWDS